MVVARRQARRCAVQAIYQWQLTGDEPRIIQEQFKTRDGYRGCDETYFRRLLDGVAEHAEALDTALAPHLDRPPAELDQVERAILRLTGFELLHCVDVPWRAAVNEAVELAKMFGASESHRYINTVLDALARLARPDELGPRRTPPARAAGPALDDAAPVATDTPDEDD
ncbi:MAG: transcription antitermination factor NusB [Gammaproteobacteria bacterium]|nr:transcription antitermination factor NusB [Gammaproteobacteria bacterium]